MKIFSNKVKVLRNIILTMTYLNASSVMMIKKPSFLDLVIIV